MCIRDRVWPVLYRFGVYYIGWASTLSVWPVLYRFGLYSIGLACTLSVWFLLYRFDLYSIGLACTLSVLRSCLLVWPVFSCGRLSVWACTLSVWPCTLSVWPVLYWFGPVLYRFGLHSGLYSIGVLYRFDVYLSLIHISEPTRLLSISYAVFC